MARAALLNRNIEVGLLIFSPVWLMAASWFFYADRVRPVPISSPQ